MQNIFNYIPFYIADYLLIAELNYELPEILYGWDQFYFVQSPVHHNRIDQKLMSHDAFSDAKTSKMFILLDSYSAQSYLH